MGILKNPEPEMIEIAAKKLVGRSVRMPKRQIGFRCGGESI